MRRKGRRAGPHLLPPAEELDRPEGVVLFAHGSGSSRHSPRNRAVAATLLASGLATLLTDLLTTAEDEAERRGAQRRFDVGLLGDRLAGVLRWVAAQPDCSTLPVGLFGASTGAAAALLAAAGSPDDIGAVVSRGGRPDLAAEALDRVTAPTLLIVGGADPVVLRLNEQAQRRMAGPCQLVVVPGATHLFEEPGALETVARLAADHFGAHLPRPA